MPPPSRLLVSLFVTVVSGLLAVSSLEGCGGAGAAAGGCGGMESERCPRAALSTVETEGREA